MSLHFYVPVFEALRSALRDVLRELGEQIE